ncbi:MAG: hypothetical protein WB116_07730 [Candidatus Dormiibacterota bacterium]
MLGLSCIVSAEASPGGFAPRGVLAELGVFALVIAALLALFERGSAAPEPNGKDRRTALPQSQWVWRWTLIGLACFGVVVAQTWFRIGTAIATGDIIPPVGTAWIARLFAPFVWLGNNLGGPGQTQGQLPWAAVDWLVHISGGSGALAQRIWLSALVGAILVAGAALARSLGLGPLAGIAAALLYFFNPHTVSDVGVNDVYLVTMVLLAALPAVLITYARGHISLWAALATFAIAAPFVGYAYANPPLVGMVALTTTATPLLVWVRFDRPAAGRALRLVLIGGAVALAVSAYWLVPDSVALGGVAVGKLSSLSAWAFTEQRATLTNALWLNTAWGWRFTAYYPYAPDFAHFPLGLIQVLLPLLAFSGLAFRSSPRGLGWRLTRLRGAIALGTLAVLFLSTGTRPPGNLLFDPLYYHLPYGWLLREPGRFLMFAALGYAMLAAIVVEHLRYTVPTSISSFRAWPKRKSLSVLHTPLALGTVAVLGLAGAFPLWTGAVVLGPRQSFPSAHVTVPSYWLETAHYLNTTGPPGSVLVLPPDDFYQMPYRWYYGSEGFIANLVDRHVLDPSAQGYDTVSATLLASVQLEASALLAHDWTEANRVLQALGTPLILVRDDIVADFPHRKILSPTALARSLASDPSMHVVHVDGLLKVYGPRKTFPQLARFATVDTATPDLRVLSTLPSNTALVTASPIRGHLAVLQLPPVATWHLDATVLSTTVPEPTGWKYSALALGPHTDNPHTQVDITQRQVVSRRGVSTLQIRVPVGPSFIHNGSFASGLWEPVGNCDDSEPVSSPNFVRADVLTRAGPGRTPALQLAASIDAACEDTELSWDSGPIVLDLWVRSLSGAPPKMCVWERPTDRCAATAPLPAGSGWHLYRTTVTPDPGTKNVYLFLYAFPQLDGQSSTEQYAGVIARSLPHHPSVDVIGRPTANAGPTRLLAYPTGYSPGWIGPANAVHVIVDGLRNGWLTTSAARALQGVHYRPIANEGRDEFLLAAAMLFLAAAGLVTWRRYSRAAPSVT